MSANADLSVKSPPSRLTLHTDFDPAVSQDLSPCSAEIQGILAGRQCNRGKPDTESPHGESDLFHHLFFIEASGTFISPEADQLRYSSLYQQRTCELSQKFSHFFSSCFGRNKQINK